MSDQEKITAFSQSAGQDNTHETDSEPDDFGWGSFGKPPKNWPIRRVEDMFEIRKNSADPEEYESGTPVWLYSMPAFDEGTEPERTTAGEIGSKKFHVPNHTLLFSKLNISKKRFWLVNHEHKDPAFCSTEYWPLLPNEDLNLEFYYQYFKSDSFINRPRLSTSSTTNSHQRIKSNLLDKVRLPVPPLSEQRKIATVLYTVDQAIEKTERTVEQMDTVQQGLLRSLFGKGKTGRKTNIETKIERLGPKQFQVPVTWETTEISSIGKVVTGDTPSTDDESNFGGNLPFVTPETLSQGKYVTESGRTLSKAGQDEAKPVPEGSVMMDCIGSDMGKVAVSGCKVATNQQINSVVIEDEYYLPEFLYYHLNVLSDFIKSQAGQTATPIVNKSSFESFAIFNPPIEEQREVVETLSHFDKGRQSNIEFLNRLKRLKHGLMQDLLSGTVRTTDTNITVPDEVAQHG